MQEMQEAYNTKASTAKLQRQQDTQSGWADITDGAF